MQQRAYMKKMIVTAVSVMTAFMMQAAPQQAGYPFDGRTGFKVSGVQNVLKADGFSVAAWVKIEDASRPQMFLTMGRPNEDFSFYLYNGAVRMLVEDEPGKYGFATAKPPQPGGWSHYLGTYDGKTAKIYRNGVLEGQQTVPLKRPSFVNPLTVGVIDGEDERILQGNMTDIRIWNRVLGADEARYLAGDETWQGRSRELIAHWQTHPTDTTIANRVKGGPELVKFQPVLAVLLIASCLASGVSGTSISRQRTSTSTSTVADLGLTARSTSRWLGMRLRSTRLSSATAVRMRRTARCCTWFRITITKRGLSRNRPVC